MIFRKFTPLHGWRSYWGEVGIVVLGVLIALALGSVAERLKWSSDVAAARQSVRYELGHNIALLKLHEKRFWCRERRLDQLGAILASAERSGRLPPVGLFPAQGAAIYPTGVWESQISAQTAAHFPREELAMLARLYKHLSITVEADERGARAWAVLASIIGPGRSADPASLAPLYVALVEARQSNATLGWMRSRFDALFAVGGVDSDYAMINPRNPPIMVPVTACTDVNDQADSVYGRVTPQTRYDELAKLPPLELQERKP